MDKQPKEKDAVKGVQENKASGCRICGCAGFVQRPGGGLVCGRGSCLHSKRDHGSIE